MNPIRDSIVDVIAQETHMDRDWVVRYLTAPPNDSMGDYAFPCFVLESGLHKKANTIATELAAKIKTAPGISQIVAVGPYLNFKIDRREFGRKILPLILDRPGFGRGTLGTGKTVVVEYSSPNIAKPFSIGTMRSTNLGQAIQAIAGYLSYKVVRINHVGDWGTQFGKLLVAYERWGNEALLEKDAVKNLNALYVRFHQESNEVAEAEARNMFQRLEGGDKKLVALWKRFRDLSLYEFETTYKRLNVEFDAILGESFYQDKIDATIQQLEGNNLTVLSEDALIVDLASEGMPPMLLKKRDGSTLYATRDLAAAFYRYNTYHFDEMVYVVGAEQQLHFKQLFATLRLMGCDWADSLKHIPFGLMLVGSKKVSTREGNVILLEDLISRTTDEALKVISEKNPTLKNKENTAEVVGLAAIKFFDLSVKRIRDIHFNWETACSLEGDTGPYLLYSQVRMWSVLKKNKSKLTSKSDQHLVEDVEFSLVKVLSQFPEIIERAQGEYEPSVLSNYLIDLAKAYNRFYSKLRILDEPASISEARLRLTKAAAFVLKEGLTLLGISTVDEM